MGFGKKNILRYINLCSAVCLLILNLTACGGIGGGDGEVTSTEAVISIPTPEATVEQTIIPTVEPELTPEPTMTPEPIVTPEPTITPTSIVTPEPTMTPAPTITPSPQSGICPALSVEGTKLVDENGNQVQLRGVSTHGLAWYPGYVNEECFRQLKEEWGANVVRLAMYTAEYGGYCSGGEKEALKALVMDGVKYATDLGMYVIIDWHILSDGNPNTYLEEAKAFFGEMAETYADYTNVLYEICNEPNGDTAWSQVKEYAEQVIAVIRQKDEDSIVLVGTPNWCQYVDQAAADPIDGYENIMYTLHFYAATHKDDLRSNMVAALEAGLPIFVSEYGICDASGSGNIDEYQAGEWVKLMDKYQISYVAWNLSNKAETSAFFRQDCSKLSGFAEDDLSVSGKWVYEMLRIHAGSGSEQTPGQQTVAEQMTIPTAAPTMPAEATAIPTTEPTAPATSTEAPGNTNSFHIQSSTGLIYTATVVNSWEQDGHTCAQYTLTITNGTEATVDNWSVSIPFEWEIAVVSSWNGNFQVEGNVLTITPVDYNSYVPEGANISDIGFILQIMQK